MRKASWGEQGNVGEVEIADRKECFNEVNGHVTGPNYNDPCVFYNFRFGQQPSCREAQGKRSIFFI